MQYLFKYIFTFIQFYRSPDFNSLDLGGWYSLSSGVPSLQTSPSTGRVIDQIIFHVLDRWEKWDSMNRLSRIFLTKQTIMKVVISVNGSNKYAIPCSSYSHYGEGPTYLPDQRKGVEQERCFERKSGDEESSIRTRDENLREEQGKESVWDVDKQDEENFVEEESYIEFGSQHQEVENNVEVSEEEISEIDNKQEESQSLSIIFHNLANGNEVLQYWQRRRAMKYHQWDLT